MPRPIDITVPASNLAATHAVFRTSATLNGVRSPAVLALLADMSGYTGTFPETVSTIVDVDTALYLHVSLALGETAGVPVGEGVASVLFPLTGDPALVTVFLDASDVGIGPVEGINMTITPIIPFLHGVELVAFASSVTTGADGIASISVPAVIYRVTIEGVGTKEIDLSAFGGQTYNIGADFSV